MLSSGFHLAPLRYRFGTFWSPLQSTILTFVELATVALAEGKSELMLRLGWA